MERNSRRALCHHQRSAYDAPSVEAITEFTLDTNAFKAEYGQGRRRHDDLFVKIPNE
jgi:hypothetical protein